LPAVAQRSRGRKGEHRKSREGERGQSTGRPGRRSEKKQDKWGGGVFGDRGKRHPVSAGSTKLPEKMGELEGPTKMSDFPRHAKAGTDCALGEKKGFKSSGNWGGKGGGGLVKSSREREKGSYH